MFYFVVGELSRNLFWLTLEEVEMSKIFHGMRETEIYRRATRYAASFYLGGGGGILY